MRRIRDFWWQLSGREAKHVLTLAIRAASGWTLKESLGMMLAYPPPPSPYLEK